LDVALRDRVTRHQRLVRLAAQKFPQARLPMLEIGFNIEPHKQPVE
jgi:hypothetical protein